MNKGYPYLSKKLSPSWGLGSKYKIGMDLHEMGLILQSELFQIRETKG